MSPNRGLVLLSILALAACDGTPSPEPLPETPADPIDPTTRVAFSGQVLLDGALKQETRGSIVISVCPVGERNPLLQRFYEALDPWRTGDALQFGLSIEDRVVERVPTFSRYMSLIVRFDTDGNPATSELHDVEVTTTVKTGASDIAVVLSRGESVAARAERDRAK